MASAIIDLGTNTFNLLLFQGDRVPLEVLSTVEVPVFLGRGGLEQGRIAEDAFQRGLTALEQLIPLARKAGAERVLGLGCSTLRHAANAPNFISIAARMGVAIRVLSGEEEAETILDGVRQAISFGTRPALVMDIGGGSIEFMLATDKALMWRQSFELGVTRLMERLPISDPITMDQELRIAEHLDAHLEPLWQVVERHEPHLLIGSAGSFDSLARMLAPEEDHTEPSITFDHDVCLDLKDRLLRMDRAQRLAVEGLPEHRVDTILYALIAMERVLLAGGIRQVAWSRYSLKEGAAWRLLNGLL